MPFDSKNPYDRIPLREGIIIQVSGVPILHYQDCEEIPPGSYWVTLRREDTDQEIARWAISYSKGTHYGPVYKPTPLPEKYLPGDEEYAKIIDAVKEWIHRRYQIASKDEEFMFMQAMGYAIH